MPKLVRTQELFCIMLIISLIVFNKGFYPSSGYKENSESNGRLIQQQTDILSIKRYSAQISNLSDHVPIVILSDEDFSKYNFTGNGTALDPIRIQNYNITTYENYAIYIMNTTKYFIISNCFLKGQFGAVFILNAAPGTVKIVNNYCSDFYDRYERQEGTGIEIMNCPHATIINNTCVFDVDGIVLRSSPYATVEGNNCSFNWGADAIYLYLLKEGNGITVYESPNIILRNNFLKKNAIFGMYIWHSNNATITNNTYYDNGDGELIISYFSDHCGSLMIEKSTNIIIRNNKIQDSNNEALYMKSCKNITIENNYSEKSGIGVFFDHCHKITVYNNSFIVLKRYGIWMLNSTDATIHLNLIQQSGCYAVVLENSSRNCIYHNTFAYTNCKIRDFNLGHFPKSEAYDSGTDNKWYNDTLKEGNWWSYIGDKDKYSIEGPAKSVDLYPLNEPIIPPTGGTPMPPGLGPLEAMAKILETIKMIIHILLGITAISLVGAVIILIKYYYENKKNKMKRR